MKLKRIVLLSTMLLTLSSSIFAENTSAYTYNVNDPNISKNWIDYYSSFYTSLPALAPPAIGIKSFSSTGSYDYKQTDDSFDKQAQYFYSNSFHEVFYPDNSRQLTNVVLYNSVASPVSSSNTGVPALDSYEPTSYKGLDETELTWLINNNIVSRDSSTISIGSDAINIGTRDPLVVENANHTLDKTDFVVALHKATLGVIESRPLAYDVIPYRYASAVWWRKVRDAEGNLLGYALVLQNYQDQLVSLDLAYKVDNYDWVVRGEFVVCLEGDEHYVMATYSDDDKLFITSPNVTELYIKSLIDNGILNSKNLYDSSYSSKNKIRSDLTGSLITEFSNYGSPSNQGGNAYPYYATETGPYEMSTGKSHIPFASTFISEGNLWGRNYSVSGSGISYMGTRFFENEDMLVMDGLKFIEAVMRVTDGDMTDTEAEIVSYKYGANFINSLSGSDKSTVMYLIAKGIIDFDNFDEFQQLYLPLTKEFGYTLLYRVANENARKNFSEIQLTDSDSFWIGRGYGSYDLTVKTPNIAALQSYTDAAGDIVMDPTKTGLLDITNKTELSPIPYSDTVSVKILGDVDSISAQSVAASNTINSIENAGLNEPAVISGAVTDGLTSTMSDLDDISYLEGLDYPIYHNSSVNIETLTGENAYASVTYANNFDMGSVSVSTTEVSDSKNKLIVVTQSIDNPYKYIYQGNPLLEGEMPSSNGAKADALGSSIIPDNVSISYNETSNQYLVSFAVEAPDVVSANQKVNSNLIATTDTLMDESSINVKSKITDKGESILLISQDSLKVIDSDIDIVTDNILINTRTGAKAVLLEQQKFALVGNAIIDSDEDSIKIEDMDGKLYYNYSIIKSLVSNTYISSTGEGDLYSLGSINSGQYKNIVTNDGSYLATGQVSKFSYTTEQGVNDTTGLVEEEEVVLDFINISQLTLTSNILTKEITMKSIEGLDVTFEVVVEWDLQLPEDNDYLDYDYFSASENPTFKEVNSFYYTRPSNGQTEYQDFWDSNIEISNALANNLYGTTGQEYIISGWLVPNVTLLFHVDDGNTEGGDSTSANAIRPDVVVPIAGAWFQQVGTHLSNTWVDTFIGSRQLYNKILSKNESSVDYFGNFSDLITQETSGYRIIANQDNIFYPDKVLNYDWFPAWVHIAFNNSGHADEHVALAESKDKVLANGTMWRKYSASRSFSTLLRNERQSTGTIFGGVKVDDVAWMKLPSGALYKSMNTGDYRNTITDVVADYRTQPVSTYNYLGKEVVYNGDRYRVTGIDGQFYELTALDFISLNYIGDEFVINGEDAVIGTSAFEMSYGVVANKFTGDESSVNYDELCQTIGAYQPLDNSLLITDYTQSTLYLFTDAYGNSDIFSYNPVEENGTLKVVKSNSVSPDIANTVRYHPTVRVSMFAWEIISTGYSFGSDESLYELKQTYTLPQSVVGNMPTGTLVSTMVDDMIAVSEDATMLSDLTSGSIINVGDLQLYKTSEGTYITSPIAYDGSKGAFTITDNKVSQQSLDVQVASMTSIPLSGDNTILNYIEDVKLAPAIDEFSGTYQRTYVSYEGNALQPAEISCAGDGSLAVNSTNLLGTPNSVSYELTITDEFMVVTPNSSNDTQYDLLLSTTGAGNGNLGNTSIALSDIDQAIMSSNAFNLKITDFEVLVNHALLKDTILKDHQTAFYGDVVYWVQAVLAFIAAYASVMCVIMFFSLKNEVFRSVMLKLKHPSKTTHGVDIVKILTLGIVNVDDEDLDGRRLALSVLLLLALFAIIVVMQKRGF